MLQTFSPMHSKFRFHSSRQHEFALKQQSEIRTEKKRLTRRYCYYSIEIHQLPDDAHFSEISNVFWISWKSFISSDEAFYWTVKDSIKKTVIESILNLISFGNKVISFFSSIAVSMRPEIPLIDVSVNWYDLCNWPFTSVSVIYSLTRVERQSQSSPFSPISEICEGGSQQQQLLTWAAYWPKNQWKSLLFDELSWFPQNVRHRLKHPLIH